MLPDEFVAIPYVSMRPCESAPETLFPGVNGPTNVVLPVDRLTSKSELFKLYVL